MIKVYTVKSNDGLILQAACTPFGVLLYPHNAKISLAFEFGWNAIKQQAICMDFRKWMGTRYRVVGVKMVRGCNE